MIGVVAGYDEGEADGRVFVIDVPDRPEPREHHAGTVGMTWGGQRDFVDRLLLGFDAQLAENNNYNGEAYTHVPLATMPLQDCAEFAAFLVRTTMQMHRFVVGLHGVSGAINVATITQAHGVRRDVLPGVTSPPGVRRIASLVANEATTTADGMGPSRYTVCP